MDTEESMGMPRQNYYVSSKIPYACHRSQHGGRILPSSELDTESWRDTPFWEPFEGVLDRGIFQFTPKDQQYLLDSIAAGTMQSELLEEQPSRQPQHLKKRRRLEVSSSGESTRQPTEHVKHSSPTQLLGCYGLRVTDQEKALLNGLLSPQTELPPSTTKETYLEGKTPSDKSSAASPVCDDQDYFLLEDGSIVISST